jgi:hypothetical protein
MLTGMKANGTELEAMTLRDTGKSVWLNLIGSPLSG